MERQRSAATTPGQRPTTRSARVALGPADLVLVKQRMAPFNDPEWLYELKIDGFRALALVERGAARLVSRNGTDFSPSFPEVVADLTRLPDCALDGELVIFREGMLSDFGALQRRSRMSRPVTVGAAAQQNPASLVAFDLLSLRGRDLRDKPIEARKRALARMLPAGRIVASQTFDDGLALFQAADRSGFEGVVAKRRGSPYRAGPSRDWLKFKTRHGLQADAYRERWNG